MAGIVCYFVCMFGFAFQPYLQLRVRVSPGHPGPGVQGKGGAKEVCDVPQAYLGVGGLILLLVLLLFLFLLLLLLQLLILLLFQTILLFLLLTSFSI